MTYGDHMTPLQHEILMSQWRARDKQRMSEPTLVDQIAEGRDPALRKAALELLEALAEYGPVADTTAGERVAKARDGVREALAR